MPPATRRSGHARRVRVAAAVVLGGYVAALGATTTGHGLRLALHLVAEHHGIHETAAPDWTKTVILSAAKDLSVSEPSAALRSRLASEGTDQLPLRGRAVAHQTPVANPRLRTTVMHDVGHASSARRSHDADRHTREAHSHGAGHHDHDDAGHTNAPSDDAPSDDAGHDDAPHAHRGQVHTHREAPPSPAWLSVSLDKHCRPPGHCVPAPCVSRGAAVLCPQAPPAAVVGAVEVPPPRREA